MNVRGKLRFQAVLLAAGSGVRLGGEVPKQFLDLAGRKVFEYSLETLARTPWLESIVLVGHPRWMEWLRRRASAWSWGKEILLVAGGESRMASCRLGLGAVRDPDRDLCVLFHDAARPGLTPRALDAVAEALTVYRAVTLALPMDDTLLTLDSQGEVAGAPPRASFVRAQTPQAFRYDLIAEAYLRAGGQGRSDFTDDCGLVRALFPGERIGVVRGDEQNFKITTPLDLQLAVLQFQGKGDANGNT